MSLTPSSMLPLGTTAPNFNLLDTISGNFICLDEIKSEVATVIFFICNHCPYVKHIQTQLIDLARNYKAKNIAFVAISANDPVQYPEDAPKKMHELGLALDFPFPYLFDEKQAIAKAYHAACTPDFYIFDKDLLCVYRGQFDDSRPGNSIPVTGNSISQALDRIIQSEPVDTYQKPSVGCNVKWQT